MHDTTIDTTLVSDQDNDQVTQRILIFVKHQVVKQKYKESKIKPDFLQALPLAPQVGLEPTTACAVSVANGVVYR